MWDEILLIQSQTSATAPLKFENGYVISSHNLWWMKVLIHAGITVYPYQYKDLTRNNRLLIKRV